MTISLIRRTIVCAGTVAVAISMAGQTAIAKQTQEPKTTTNVVDCDKGASIQTAVDAVKVGDPTLISIAGTCTENITITTDDITLEGAATVEGTITISGVLST